MNCEQCEPLLTQVSRSELTAAYSAEVAVHLQHCAACSKQLAGLVELQALLDVPELPSPGAVQQFQQRLTRELQNGTTTALPAKKGLPGLLHALWPARPAWAFAYSVLLLSCGLISGQLLPPDTLGLRSAGLASTSDASSISRERLIQMCSVQDQQNLDVL